MPIVISHSPVGTVQPLARAGGRAVGRQKDFQNAMALRAQEEREYQFDQQQQMQNQRTALAEQSRQQEMEFRTQSRLQQADQFQQGLEFDAQKMAEIARQKDIDRQRDTAKALWDERMSREKETRIEEIGKADREDVQKHQKDLEGTRQKGYQERLETTQEGYTERERLQQEGQNQRDQLKSQAEAAEKQAEITRENQERAFEAIGKAGMLNKWKEHAITIDPNLGMDEYGWLAPYVALPTTSPGDARKALETAMDRIRELKEKGPERRTMQEYEQGRKRAEAMLYIDGKKNEGLRPEYEGLGPPEENMPIESAPPQIISSIEAIVNRNYFNIPAGDKEAMASDIATELGWRVDLPGQPPTPAADSSGAPWYGGAFHADQAQQDAMTAGAGSLIPQSAIGVGGVVSDLLPYFKPRSGGPTDLRQ